MREAVTTNADPLDALLADIAELEATDPDTVPVPVETDAERRARALAELDALLALEDTRDPFPWYDSMTWRPPTVPADPVPVAWAIDPLDVGLIRPAAPMMVYVGGRYHGTRVTRTVA